MKPANTRTIAHRASLVLAAFAGTFALLGAFYLLALFLVPSLYMHARMAVVVGGTLGFFTLSAILAALAEAGGGGKGGK